VNGGTVGAVIIPLRFNGPTGSGNGGYTSGLLAAHLDVDTAQVTLRLPPPLGTPLELVHDGPKISAYDDDKLIAEVVEAPAVTALVPAVDLATATTASRSYPGFTDHPFPQCYVCGPERPNNDGLEIYPGRLDDGRMAAPWRVPKDVGLPVLWAALDCPGGWSVIAPGRPYVLGRMTATLQRIPSPGETCVVVGQCVSTEGRKASVLTSLYDATGALVAAASATWIALAQ